MLAERKAGPIVRQTRYMMKKFWVNIWVRMPRRAP